MVCNRSDVMGRNRKREAQAAGLDARQQPHTRQGTPSAKTRLTPTPAPRCAVQPKAMNTTRASQKERSRKARHGHQSSLKLTHTLCATHRGSEEMVMCGTGRRSCLACACACHLGSFCSTGASRWMVTPQPESGLMVGGPYIGLRERWILGTIRTPTIPLTHATIYSTVLTTP